MDSRYKVSIKEINMNNIFYDVLTEYKDKFTLMNTSLCIKKNGIQQCLECFSNKYCTNLNQLSRLYLLFCLLEENKDNIKNYNEMFTLIKECVINAGGEELQILIQEDNKKQSLKGITK